jgi:hypothetical protein
MAIFFNVFLFTVLIYLSYKRIKYLFSTIETHNPGKTNLINNVVNTNYKRRSF